MTEKQIDIMTVLSACSRRIGYAQGILEAIENRATDRAISELDALSNQLYSFMLDLAMEKDGEQK